MLRKTPLTGNILAHKIALNLTKSQEAYCYRASGVARFAWNWALREWNEQYSLFREYRCGPKPSAFDISKKLNSIKDVQFPWLKEVASVPRERAILQLGEAFKRFFDKISGRPRFKGKGNQRSFVAAATADNFVVSGRKIRIPVIGWLKMREELRFSGTPLSATISLVGGRWFVAINVDVPHVIQTPSSDLEVGVDLGIKTMATVSDGTSFQNPMPLRENLKKYRRLSRSHSRKKNGSNNKRKSALKLARLHARVANIRKEMLHTTTSHIARTYTRIGIENLNIKGMTANRKLSRPINDVGMYEFRRQLEYKAPLHGSKIIVADRWYPSSKRCSACGKVKDDMSLTEREWTCSECGTHHDRDLNAALNLRPSQIELHVAATQAVSACGEKSSGKRRKTVAKLVSKKQESSTVLLDINGLSVSPHGYLTDVG